MIIKDFSKAFPKNVKVTKLQKLVRTNDDIHDAVKAWSSSRHEAEKKYGPMPVWDTS